MSYEIVNEVLTQQPADLSPGERLVLFVLAHHADKRTRECWPGMKTLCRETGMHEDSVRKSFVRLARRGIDLRASTAHRRHRTVYRIPPMPERQDVRAGHSSAERPDATSGHSSGKPGRSSRESPDDTSAPEGQEPSEQPDRRMREPTMNDFEAAQVAKVAAVLGIAEAVALDVVHRWVQHYPDLRKPFAVIDGKSEAAIRQEMDRYKPKPPPRPRCSACDGLGRALSRDDRRPTSEPCPACGGSRYLDPPQDAA